MIIIYYILALVFFITGAIFLIPLSFKQKYKNSIPARFFLINNKKFKKSDLHFHLCSFGEVMSMKPILSMFEKKSISVTTQTGYDEACKICDNVRYLPFEIFLPFWLNKTKVLVIFEAELWLMLVYIAKLKGSKIILINARISDRSYGRYLKFRFLYRKIFSYIDIVYAQSKLDKDRLEILGAKNVIICGNIKSSFLPSITKEYEKPNKRVITFASTHAKEEELLLKNIKFRENDKFLFVPRHPERFDEVADFLLKWARENSLSFSRFSEDKSLKSDICLIDILGELVNFYYISDIVILGGSFIQNIGGHNPFESAQFHKTLISGKNIFNQKVLFSLIDDVIMADADELDGLLSKENLPKCKIKKKADVSMIINEIRNNI